MIFLDRKDAGKRLSRLLSEYKNEDAIVFGLPRGGVVVAYEISQYLKAPLDLIFAHKIGYPNQPEYAMAAISESGHVVFSEEEPFRDYPEWFENEKTKELNEIKRKRALYLKNREEISLEGKLAFLVDDGIATGLTFQAGILELRDRNPKKIIALVPVSPKSQELILNSMVDEFLCLETPDDYQFRGSVGSYYEEFDQVDDQEVIDLLNRAKSSL